MARLRSPREGHLGGPVARAVDLQILLRLHVEEPRLGPARREAALLQGAERRHEDARDADHVAAAVVLQRALIDLQTRGKDEREIKEF